MAPTRKISKAPEADADGPEAVRAKTEPQSLCINGKAGKSLQNAVTYKLSKAPDFVKIDLERQDALRQDVEQQAEEGVH